MCAAGCSPHPRTSVPVYNCVRPCTECSDDVQTARDPGPDRGNRGGRETAHARPRGFSKSIIPYQIAKYARRREGDRCGERCARARKNRSIVLCICTGPTLSTENHESVRVRENHRRCQTPQLPPTPPIAPPSASPLSAIASRLLVFRPSPSVRLRPPPPLAPRRAARPVRKRAAVHHGRGPRAPCPHVEADLSRAGLWASWAAASRGSCASRSRQAAPPT